MASYRPKSLDELNNMYDKTLSAEQAIKKGTSKLANESGVSVEPIPAVNMADIPTVPDIIKDSATDKEIEDLSFAVDNFIRHFSGEPSKPAPAPTPSYPRTPIRNQNQHKPNAQMIQKELNASTIPEEGDLSGLMNEYIKIMNDEDDEPLFGRRNSRHKKKDRKKNHGFTEESPAEPEIQTEPEVQPEPEAPEIQLNEPEVIAPAEPEYVQPAFEAPAPEVQPAYDDDSYASDYNYDYSYDYAEEEEVEEKPSKKASRKAKKAAKKAAQKAAEEAVSEAEEEAFEPAQEENLEEAFERLDEEDEDDVVQVRSSAGRIVLRSILSIIFVLCLVATAAVASMNLVLNINTGKKALGNYYFFTATYDYEDAGIKTNDFIICESSTYLIDGTKSVFIYTDADDGQRKVAFGVKNGGMTDDDGHVLYLIGNQQVAREDALGTVENTLPKLGKIVDLIFDYYLIFIVALAALTIILFILITLVLRNKNKALIKEQKKAAKQLKKAQADAEEEYEEEADTDTDMEASEEFDSADLYNDLFSDID